MIKNLKTQLKKKGSLKLEVELNSTTILKPDLSGLLGFGINMNNNQV
jgi:hypothetical protein